MASSSGHRGGSAHGSGEKRNSLQNGAATPSSYRTSSDRTASPWVGTTQLLAEAPRQHLHHRLRVPAVGIEVWVEDRYGYPKRSGEETDQKFRELVGIQPSGIRGVDGRHPRRVEDVDVEVDPVFVQPDRAPHSPKSVLGSVPDHLGRGADHPERRACLQQVLASSRHPT